MLVRVVAATGREEELLTCRFTIQLTPVPLLSVVVGLLLVFRNSTAYERYAEYVVALSATNVQGPQGLYIYDRGISLSRPGKLHMFVHKLTSSLSGSRSSRRRALTGQRRSAAS